MVKVESIWCQAATTFKVLALTLIALSSTSAQSFSAYTDAKQILEGSTVSVTFELKGGKGTKFTAPDFGNLEVVGGPSRSFQSSNYNGRITQTASYSYVLFAEKTGAYTIPSAYIQVNGKRFSTEPITIEVIKGKSKQPGESEGKDVYVEIEASDTTAIIGQQITLVYKLYTQVDVNNYDFRNEPDYDGFFSANLRNFRSSVQREIINGNEYYTKEIKKVALFPQRTGVFEIDPVLVNIAIPIPGRRNSFFSQPSKRKTVRTNGLRLVVKDPPPGAPISFSGAVGKYKIKTTINKSQITTDDAFVVNMEVNGTGDGKTFSAAQQPSIDHLEFYDPNVVRDEDRSNDGVIANYKLIEYLIVPKQAGVYSIRPEFTYYDSDSNDYITLYDRTYRVQVKPGTRRVTSDNRDVSITRSLKGQRTSSSSLSSFQLEYNDSFLWIGVLLSTLGLMFIGVKKFKEDQLSNLDPEEKRRRKSLAIANAQLAKAKEFQESGDTRRFFEELSRTMNGYLGNKYGLPNTDFKRDKIIEVLEINNVSENLKRTYLEILDKCEKAIFAGLDISETQELLENAKGLILDLEK